VPCNGYPFRRTITLSAAMNSTIEIRGRCLIQSARLSPGNSISDVEESGNFQRVLLQALELRQPYREVFLLRDIQGHTLSEAACILGVSRDTAVARLKQARHELQWFASVDVAKGRNDDTDDLALSGLAFERTVFFAESPGTGCSARSTRPNDATRQLGRRLAVQTIRGGETNGANGFDSGAEASPVSKASLTNVE
jgi:hypothetical protein